MMQTADQPSYTQDGDESSRRRSTFYVPLTSSCEDLHLHVDERKKSVDHIYNPDLSACSFDWSMNDSIDNSELMVINEKNDETNKHKRYGIVLNQSVNIDDSNLEINHRQKSKATSSTPIKLIKSKSRSSINEPVVLLHPAADPSPISPLKEKSKTLPPVQLIIKEHLITSTFPPKTSFLLKSTPKMSSSVLNYSSLSDTSNVLTVNEPKATSSPKKSLSFIRRAHSTKLSRSNSLLKSLTSKCVEQSNEHLLVNVNDLALDRLESVIRSDKSEEIIKEMFFREPLDSSTECCNSSTNGKDKKFENEEDVHSGKRFFSLIFVDVLRI